MKRTARTTASTVGALIAEPVPDTRVPAGVTEQVPYTADS